MAADLIEDVMGEGLQVVDRVRDDGLLLGNAGGEEGQRGGEGEGGEQLVGSLLLLQLLPHIILDQVQGRWELINCTGTPVYIMVQNIRGQK